MRINLWGGSGCGKSATAAGCFYFLKCKSWNIELVREYIKSWAYENKKPKSFDQSYIFAKQLHAEDHVLQHGVDHLITDSPLMMQNFYAKRYGFSCWQQNIDVALAFESKFPSINILLDREGLDFKQEGRYEDEEQALQIDREMKVYLDKYVKDYIVFKTKDLEGIVEYVDHILQQSSPIIPPDPGILIRALRKFLT